MDLDLTTSSLFFALASSFYRRVTISVPVRETIHSEKEWDFFDCTQLWFKR